MDEETKKTSGLITSVHFVKRGVAKSNPEKVELTKEELKGIIQETASALRLQEDEEENENENMEINETANFEEEFKFDNYDNEETDTSKIIGLGSIASFDDDEDLKDYHINIDGADSDEEDDIIKPTDNLILIGHIQGDASVLEIYVYNESEDSLYVHHDILLPSIPLCIEWLDRDPSDDKPANLCAIGSMDPIIHVWDLDIMNCLEPAYKLGKKGSKKKRIPAIGHSDAVLTLSWNKQLDHILASGSVDKTVLLWDVDKGDPHTKIAIFEDKVQDIRWHPLEMQSLLSGCSDKKSRISDCRTDNANLSWSFDAEVEKVCWNTHKPFCFASGIMNGNIAYTDCRQSDPVWILEAHSGEVTGLSLSSHYPGMMVSASDEGCLKVWDISGNFPELIAEKSLAIGATQCLSVCPENPFVYAAGGDFKSKNFGVWDIKQMKTVAERFT